MVIIAEFFAFYKRICTFFPEKLFLFKTPTRTGGSQAAGTSDLCIFLALGGFTNKFAARCDIPDFPIVIFLTFRC